MAKGDSMGAVGPIMSGPIRDLMLKILDGKAVQPPYTRIPSFLFYIYKHPQCLEILQGIVNRGYIGLEFLGWLDRNHAGNIKSAVGEILNTRVLKRARSGLFLVN